jgi:transposase
MGYKPHLELAPRLIGYDPVVELPQDHFARFVDEVVDNYATVPGRAPGPGQPPYDPRPLWKVLLYAYAMGVFSSRRMEQNCYESLPYMLLVRDDRPSYGTLATARRESADELAWLLYCLHEVALGAGMKFLGRIFVDSTKYKADVSGESVIRRELYDEVRSKLKTILEQAEKADSAEDEEGQAVHTRTGVAAGSVHMRDILRQIKKNPTGPTGVNLSPKMRERVKEAIDTLESAAAAGVSHVSLTDPDARMMGLGSRKTVGMGHSLEVAAENGLLVHFEVIHQSSDAGRLPAAVEGARQNAPGGVNRATADSGYYNGQDVVDLADAGLEVIVPTPQTACDLKRGDPAGTASGQVGEQIEFKKLEDEDAYVCPQGNILRRIHSRVKGRREFLRYRASKPCAGCPLAQACLKQKGAKHRTIMVSEHGERLRQHQLRFKDPEVQRIYHERGPGVETVFAGMGHIQGFGHWHVRGAEAVEAEGALLSASYQLRKTYKFWTANRKAA